MAVPGHRDRPVLAAGGWLGDVRAHDSPTGLRCAADNVRNISYVISHTQDRGHPRRAIRHPGAYATDGI